METKAKEKRFLIGLIGIFFFLTFLTSPGFTQIPQKINYQGYLTDSGSNPINGTVQMEFNIYDVSSGGTALWSETQNVSVNQGVYSVNLGDVNPLNLPFDKTYYLGVKVGGDPEMTPRRELTSVGYAFRAITVDTIGSHTHSASDITSGTLDNARFSAYSDLGSEGYLDNNADTDILTRLQADGRYVNEGQANSITSAMIVDGQVGVSDIDPSQVQRRVSGTCGAGSSIRVINQDGTVTCETDDNSGGTVTQVNTGTGLTGGPITISGTISLSSTYSDGSAYDSRFVNVTGDTMTGSLSVGGDINTNGVYKLGGSTILRTPISNTFLGNWAGNSNTTGYKNTFLGDGAGFSNTTGYQNTFLGRYAGYSNTTGNRNTFLGDWAGTSNTTGSGNVFIGDSAGFSETGSNKLYIDNSYTSSPLIYGDFSANSVTINGDLQVTGRLTKGSGSFVQPHAKDPTKEIVYAFFEGPEHAVFFRGEGRLIDGQAIIELPEHFSVIAAENGIQVQVTPTEDCNGIFVKSKSRERIEVKELMKGKSNAKFDYFVTAIRAGFEKHEPVVENTNFRPKENERAKDFEERFNGDDMTTKAMKAMLISNGILTKDGELNMEVVQRLGWKVKETEVAKVEK